MEETLVRMGYEVAGLAVTGAAAVDLALQEKPDAHLLMDIRLRGDMTGIEAAEEIGKKTMSPSST